MIKYNVFKTKKEASKAAYETFKKYLKPNSVLGLATGGTPTDFYKEIIEDYKLGNVSYKNNVTFNLDEYVGISYDHPESYHKFMDTNLFDHIDIDRKNINIPDASSEHLADEIKKYQNKLNDTTINIQLLGVGSNGHIGFNEPGTFFNVGVHIVDLKEDTIEANSRFFNNDTTLVPKQAVTMGIADIMKSEVVILLAFGENKKEAIKSLFDENEPTIDIPCTILKNHPNVYVFVDEEADYQK